MTVAKLRLGTRRSSLAQTQSRLVARWLEERHTGLEVELVPIVSQGDRQPGDLSAVGGKGLFTWELEARLRDGSLDLAVHSLKDLPVDSGPELVVAAYPEREDARDVLVSEDAESLGELPPGAVLLTGSLRRRAQILALRPDLVVKPVRGNVETRLRKWRQQGANGVILAAAGLRRLGLFDQVPAHPIPPHELIPAPGQGTLAVQVPKGSEAEPLCRVLNHAPTELASQAERAVVAEFGADCTMPLAAWAHLEGSSELRLRVFLADPDGRQPLRSEAWGEDPKALAAHCAAQLRELGADRVLAPLQGA